MMREPTGASTPSGRSPARFLPLAVLVLGLVLFFALGLNRYVTFGVLQEHREWLTTQVRDHVAVSTLTFTAIYALATAFSIPVGAALTICGGFLFGIWVAAACVLVGATVGACALFLAARTALADILRAKAGPALQRMEAGFRENALNYLLVLRLIPVFPFWLVNLVPAFLGVSLRTYVIGTFVGIIPGTLVYASLGNGLGAILDAGERPDLDIIFDPEILLPILGLAVLALLPVVYKKVKGRQAAGR